MFQLACQALLAKLWKRSPFTFNTLKTPVMFFWRRPLKADRLLVRTPSEEPPHVSYVTLPQIWQSLLCLPAFELVTVHFLLFFLFPALIVLFSFILLPLDCVSVEAAILINPAYFTLTSDERGNEMRIKDGVRWWWWMIRSEDHSRGSDEEISHTQMLRTTVKKYTAWNIHYIHRRSVGAIHHLNKELVARFKDGCVNFKESEGKKKGAAKQQPACAAPPFHEDCWFKIEAVMHLPCSCARSHKHTLHILYIV